MKYLLDLGSHVCLAVLNGEVFFRICGFWEENPGINKKKVNTHVGCIKPWISRLEYSIKESLPIVSTDACTRILNQATVGQKFYDSHDPHGECGHFGKLQATQRKCPRTFFLT